ncbi:hypothetical protein HZB01_04710 [Candidatus Woesearchaeota archaeon]|nr:hypothetical protein [Candidatus Woesearchaeota archaeon]
MKATYGLGIAVSALAVISILAIAAAAYTGNGYTQGSGNHHAMMEKLMETGMYQDLVALREETGMPIMPWVTDENAFDEMKEHHEEMEKLHEQGGMGMMGRDMHSRGMMGGGCRQFAKV